MYAIRIDVTTGVADGAGNTTIPWEYFTPHDPLNRGAGVRPLLLYAVEWIDGTLSDGSTATLTCEDTLSGVAQTLLTLANPKADADKWYRPRHLEHGADGSDLTTTTLPLVTGDLKLAIASGGNSKTCGCICYLMDA